MKKKPTTESLYDDEAAIVAALQKLGWRDSPENRHKLRRLRVQDRARRDQMTFGEAFAEARQAHGGDGGVFMWQGKKYSTDVAKPKPAKPSTPIDKVTGQGIGMEIIGDSAPQRKPITMNKQQDANFYSPTFMAKQDIMSNLADHIRKNKGEIKEKMLEKMIMKINRNTDKQREQLSKKEYNLGGAVGLAGGLADMFIQPDQYGVTSDAGAAVGGALKGAGLGAAFGPIGMGAGALLGGVSSIVQNNKMERQRDAAREAYKESLEKRHMQQQQQQLAVSPTQGIRGNQLYKSGGKIKYMDGGLTKFVGPSHEQGGIDHPAGIEVEGGETQIQDVIYSDELVPSPDFMQNFKYLGLKKDDTFADVSEKLTKLKGKYEGDSQSDNQMRTKIDQALASLKGEQMEVGVQPNEEYERGGVIDPVQGREMLFPAMSAMAPQRNIAPVNYTPKYNSKFQFYTDKAMEGLKSGVNQLSANPYALNAMNYLGNLNTINKLETERTPLQESTVPLDYRDNRTAQFNRNAVQAREIGNQMNFADPQAQRANRAKLAAELFSANNEVDAREDAMYNDQVSRNQFMNAQINARNTGRLDAAQDEAMGNRNFIRNQRLNARNAFMDGIQGNRQMDQLRDLDVQKLSILANANPSGVGTRAIDDFMEQLPQLRKLLSKVKKKNG